MLASDQTNEKKMNQIRSLKQDYNVENMTVIVCLVYDHQKCTCKQKDQYSVDWNGSLLQDTWTQQQLCFSLLYISGFDYMRFKIEMNLSGFNLHHDSQMTTCDPSFEVSSD